MAWMDGWMGMDVGVDVDADLGVDVDVGFTVPSTHQQPTFTTQAGFSTAQIKQQVLERQLLQRP